MEDRTGIESPAETPAPSPPTTSLGWWVVGVTTVIVVIGAAVVLLFNPILIGVEQQRAGVPPVPGAPPRVAAARPFPLPFAMLLVVATVVPVAIVAANRRNGWVWRAIARA